MEIVHRENIINNIDKLIVLTKYGELMFQCIHHGLINDVMKDNIEVRYTNSNEDWRAIQKWNGVIGYNKLMYAWSAIISSESM